MKAALFFTGALAGLVTGLLLAPEKGEDLRSEIAESAEKLRDEIADSAEKLKKKFLRAKSRTGAELNDLREMLEDEVSGLGDDIRYRILSILDESEERAGNLKREIKSELS